MLQFALEPLLSASTANMQAGLYQTFSLIGSLHHALLQMLLSIVLVSYQCQFRCSMKYAIDLHRRQAS